jgi:hypothetical protein
MIGIYFSKIKLTTEYSLIIDDHHVLEGYIAESSSIQEPLFNKNKCPKFTLGRLISKRPRWVYDMKGVDSAANMVNCEGLVDVTIRHAACEITNYATNNQSFTLRSIPVEFLFSYLNIQTSESS